MRLSIRLLFVASVALLVIVLTPVDSTVEAKPGDDKPQIGVCHWNGAVFEWSEVDDKGGKPKGHDKGKDHENDFWPAATSADCPTTSPSTTTATTKPAESTTYYFVFCTEAGICEIASGTVAGKEFVFKDETIHVSCSDDFPGGLGAKDGPTAGSGWFVASFEITRTKKDGKVVPCSGGTPPTTTTTTTPATTTTTTPGNTTTTTVSDGTTTTVVSTTSTTSTTCPSCPTTTTTTISCGCTTTTTTTSCSATATTTTTVASCALATTAIAPSSGATVLVSPEVIYRGSPWEALGVLLLGVIAISSIATVILLTRLVRR